jgi:hypothetical protein
MCQNHELVEILWVSSLAYPNLFGTKGFVVVVVLINSPKFTVIDMRRVCVPAEVHPKHLYPIRTNASIDIM